jgi:hypothetical protein
MIRMMNSKLLMLLFSCILGLSTFTSISFVESQFQSNVSINADGSIDPGTAPIQHNGDVYTLTDNISGSMSIHKSNVVIDGAGYALNGHGGTGIDLTGNLTEYPSMYEIRNVTVENLGIINFNFSINARGSSQNTFYNDYIGNTTNDVNGGVFLYWNAGGNNITHCTIIGTPYAIGIELSSGNTITENNLLGGILLQLGGNETVDRNYWSDYLTRYPNASEIDSSGVGNTPYVFNEFREMTGILQDNHPLMNPVPVPNFPTLLPNGTTTLRSSPSVPEFALLVILLLPFSIFLVAVKFRHRKAT